MNLCRAVVVPALALVAAGGLGACGSSTKSPSLAKEYLAIANAGNEHLERDFDGLEGHDRNDLAGARADLRDAAATEHRFDHALLAIAFPAATEATATELSRVNEARAALSMHAAAATSMTDLHDDLPEVTAMNAPVERAVTELRKQLGLPPPESS